MTTPHNWIPGEPITAARLNVGQQESLRARRQVSIGAGSSMVNEVMGNQSVNIPKIMIRLAVAIEDFSPAGTITDLAGASDDVPSGLCKWFRLDRKSGNHVEDILSPPFLCYDVIGGLNNGLLKSQGEIFYAIYNEDSKRHEALQSSDIKLTYGIVGACLGDGWYEIEISDWNDIPGETSSSDSNSLSVSSSGSDDPCDLCVIASEQIAQQSVEDCTEVFDVEIPRNVGAGTGEIVYAHTASLMTLLAGSHVKMIKRAPGTSASSTSSSASASSSGSQSTSVSDDIITDRLYDIVDASKALVSLPFPHYECCTLPDGSKEVRLVRCVRVVVEGIACPISENPCPTSDSISESV